MQRFDIPAHFDSPGGTMATNFYGFDHVDTRVRSLAAVEPFYDLLMPRLGLVRKRYANVDGDEWSDAEPGGAYNAVEFYQERTGEGAPFFIGLIEDRAMQPT
ncbi:MAG: hypothetical protein JO359_09380, partial [Candidatus Eremiobacteraeota bacterium]|nr:hypothetical protein [Candidatus Eremiobacteraeota bacterium]